MSHVPPEDRRSPTRLPAHPEAESRSAGEDHTPINWAVVVVLGLVGAVVAVIVILHLAGVVGPAGLR